MKIKSINVFDPPIYISTWQSLKDLPKEFFYQFKVVICDEAHGAKADILFRKISLCINAKYRFGFTGTVPTELLPKKQILGLFVNHNKITTYEQCKEDNIVTPVKIKCLELSYNISNSHDSKISYTNEIKYLQGNNNRHNFIQKLSSKEGNTLILFMKVEKHSKVIYEKMIKNESLKNKEIYIMDSSTPIEERDRISKLIDSNNNIIILATYSLLSTGWSVNNLKNIIYADPTKSEVLIPQSIGRGMRKAQDKDFCTIYDIVDKFNYVNFAYNHFKKRVKIYKERKYDFEIIKFEGKYD